MSAADPKPEPKSEFGEFDPRLFLKTVTDQPGVYRMYDAERTVIYVGKAKNLKKRLSSYFRSKVDSAKTAALVKQIRHIDVTVTHTETEALVLESTWIKQHQPRYNVRLMDDKSYPYILLTKHRHPRLTLYRGSRKQPGKYFGPYPNGGAVRESLRLMQKIFPVRQCEDSYYRNRSRPCLQYHIKRCLGPCADKCSDQAYDDQVKLVEMFLTGRSQEVLNDLVKRMEEASKALQFEKAAQLRDQMLALRTVQEQQYVSGEQEELDILGLAREAGMTCVHLLMMRHGRMLGSRSFFPKIPADTPDDEVLAAFIGQHYLLGTAGTIPKEIIYSGELSGHKALSEALTEQAGRKCRLASQVRADRARYQQLALTNAQTALITRLAERSSLEKRFRALQDVLELDEPILRMECFDISHTMGEQTVASCVVFASDGPLKSQYRKYNITDITPGDDYAAMHQALTRRYRPKGDSQEQARQPDILFIDGGKGQMTQAEEVFDELGVEPPLMVGVAKGEGRKAGLEKLILAVSHEEVHLPPDSPALHLVQQIRDEAHRFAITGHRAQRAKAKRTSALEGIPGVGPKRRQQLLKFLGGMQEVRKASVDELAKVPGISRELAEQIQAHLRGA